MKEKILVGLKTTDRMTETVSFLEDIGRPGMKILFLIPYPVRRWSFLPPHCDDAEIGRAATFVNREHLSQFSWQSQQNLAEAKVADACRILDGKNVAIEYEFYSGPLTLAIHKRLAHSDFQWVVMPAFQGGRLRLVTSVRDAFARLWWRKTSRIHGMYIRQVSGDVDRMQVPERPGVKAI